LFFSNPQIQGHFFALAGKCLHALRQERHIQLQVG
jgi:hypothetical protein